MYNTKFNTISECQKLNNLSDIQVVSLLKRFLENQNYREDYNSRKNGLNKLLQNDPVVKQRYEELRKKQG